MACLELDNNVLGFYIPSVENGTKPVCLNLPHVHVHSTAVARV